jgi:hypothetical protein
MNYLRFSSVLPEEHEDSTMKNIMAASYLSLSKFLVNDHHKLKLISNSI